jgi:hypothetical protein
MAEATIRIAAVARAMHDLVNFILDFLINVIARNVTRLMLMSDVRSCSRYGPRYRCNDVGNKDSVTKPTHSRRAGAGCDAVQGRSFA